MKVEGLGVLDWVNYQRDDLEHSSQGEEAPDHSEEDQHLGSAEGEEGQHEADDEDDKSAEEHGGRRPSPRVLHEALASFLVGPAAAALAQAFPPERGRLAMVARLQPASAGQRYDVEGDGAEQEQGQDPPAAFAGQAAAQHRGRSRRGAERGSVHPI